MRLGIGVTTSSAWEDLSDSRPTQMYRAAGIKHRFSPGRVRACHSPQQPGVRDDLAAQLKALGEPARLAIIERLSA